MKNNKRPYLLMIVGGIVLTLLLIATIWTKDEIDVIFNILAMIGGGIFCSAIVSWIIEENNIRKAREEKIKQREFILKGIKKSLKTYIFWEVDQLSQYDLLQIDDSLKTRRRIEYSIAEVISKLREYIAKINIAEESFYGTANIAYSEYLTIIEKRNKLVYKDILPLIKRIEEGISYVLLNETFYYINNFLDGTTLNILEHFRVMIKDITTFSESEHFDLVLGLKKDFLDKVNDLLTCLGVDLEEKMNVFIWENMSKS